MTATPGAGIGWAPEAPTGLLLTGATMELAGTPGPATVIYDVSLSLSPSGLSVIPPLPAAPTTVPWPSMVDARCGEPGVLPDGSPAVAVSAIVAGRFVRWLVPADQMPGERATAIDLLLAARTGRPPALTPEVEKGDAPKRRARRRQPDVAVLLAPPRREDGGPQAAPRVVATPLPAPAATAEPPPATAEPPPATAEPPPATAEPLPATAEPPPAAAEPPPATATPRAAPAGRRSRARRRSTVVLLLWLAIAVLVAAGAAALALTLTSSGHGTGGARTAIVTDRAIARAVNLRLADLPTGWTVSPTPNGPLSGFLGDHGLARSGSPGSALSSGVAIQYETCMGVAGSRDTLLGATAPEPVAHAGSPAFVGPSSGPAFEAASSTAVYGSATSVTSATAELARPRFAKCFGTAVGEEFRVAAQASSEEVQVHYGNPKVVVLSLPRIDGTRASGVDVLLPLAFSGAKTTSVELGFVFVTGARVESTLVTFGTASGFPAPLTDSLAGELEKEIGARAGSASSTSA